MKRKVRLVAMAVAVALSAGGTLIAVQAPADAGTASSTVKAKPKVPNPKPNAKPKKPKKPKEKEEEEETPQCQRNKFEVKTNTDDKFKWSVFGDLFAGDGSKTYHWEEKDKKGGKDHVKWEFNYCGDNGWADILIKPDPDHEVKKEKLKLDRNYCWELNQSQPGALPRVDDCP